MPKWATVAVDSAGELARLCFSWEMKKSAGEYEQIRAVNNYPGATERLNMLVRRAKTLKALDTEVVFTAHDDIQKIYGKGGAISTKGQPASEPIAVKGWPDIPGNTAPGEFCRACDNVLRMRLVNKEPTLIAVNEPLGGGLTDSFWEVKDRFGAKLLNGPKGTCLEGRLPADYELIAKLAQASPQCNWEPAYIWLVYGVFGIGKTRLLRTFPRPMKVFDLDRGIASIPSREREGITVSSFDPESKDEYLRFIREWEECIS